MLPDEAWELDGRRRFASYEETLGEMVGAISSDGNTPDTW